jgi:hypothetical protein
MTACPSVPDAVPPVFAGCRDSVLSFDVPYSRMINEECADEYKF